MDFKLTQGGVQACKYSSDRYALYLFNLTALKAQCKQKRLNSKTRYQSIAIYSLTLDLLCPAIDQPS